MKVLGVVTSRSRYKIDTLPSIEPNNPTNRSKKSREEQNEGEWKIYDSIVDSKTSTAQSLPKKDPCGEYTASKVGVDGMGCSGGRIEKGVCV